ncbi:MAG: HEAT repeat domain-containing protein [Verrucomicrobia bacterium]|nr:HEAT repeat domain-containing protein [Verrucomicrobiota bacterium]
MKLRTSVIMAALGIALALPLHAADMSQLITDAAKYESGQSVEPLRKFEQLLRDSAGKPALRTEMEVAMIKLLAPPATFEAKRFACQQLAAIGTDASLPALAELLKKEETTGIACLALGVHPSAKANATLRVALASAKGRARLQIATTLGDRRDAEAVKSLSEMARDNDALAAGTAIFALGKIANEPARKTIAALRKEAKPALARVVADASLSVADRLAASGDRKGAAAICEEFLQPAQPDNIRRGAFGLLLKLEKDGGEQRIVAALRGTDAKLKPVAIAAIGALKSRDASKKFAAELPKLQPAEQVFMIEALASRGDSAVRDPIRALIASADAAVRRAAIVAVGRLDDASVVPQLMDAMTGEKSPEELQDIETALVSLRGNSSTDRAIVAELKEVPAEARVRLFSVLARRGAHLAVPALLAETSSLNPATVQAAFQAVGKLAKADDLPAVLERLVGMSAADSRSDGESAAVRVLQKITDPAQRTDVIMARMTKCSDIDGRSSLLRLLPSTGDAKALEVLKTACGDKEPRIREAAVRALATWPNVAAWDMLAAVCRQPETETVRALAFRGLVRLAGDLNSKPDAELIERYRKLMSMARNADDLKLFLGALSGVAHPDALKPALSLLGANSVRPEAELAVRKIAAAVKAQHPEAAREAMQRLQPPPKPSAKAQAAAKGQPPAKKK